MSRLWIMRHGEAGDTAPDSARELTPHGKRQVADMADRLARRCETQALPVTRIVTSPYVRARQTAAVMGQALGVAVETLSGITPEDSPRAFCDWLANQPGNLLVVSHMPLVGALAGLLVEGREDQGRAFPTAGIAELDADVWAAGCARQVTFSAP
ncbi:phosphohistidine phosphatase SixA [Halomonas cibimaris]|uniref:Phosphohistidine phosphatase SixA n=1 Tax=Halomonas cibimaris TaxID=657012 RepID=A0ABP7L9Z0_9GAMM